MTMLPASDEFLPKFPSSRYLSLFVWFLPSQPVRLGRPCW